MSLQEPHPSSSQQPAPHPSPAAHLPSSPPSRAHPPRNCKPGPMAQTLPPSSPPASAAHGPPHAACTGLRSKEHTHVRRA
uniref:Uncharacterized protein n=1 Tax=Arundo donax TaxID=35708 RepID=A0A0A9E6D6_ARUDO